MPSTPKAIDENLHEQLDIIDNISNYSFMTDKFIPNPTQPILAHSVLAHTPFVFKQYYLNIDMARLKYILHSILSTNLQ